MKFNLKQLDEQQKQFAREQPGMYIVSSDPTVVINRYQVIQNVYRFCDKNGISVRYPFDITANNHVTYVRSVKMLEIGEITDLSISINNIIDALLKLVNDQENISAEQIWKEIGKNIVYDL